MLPVKNKVKKIEQCSNSVFAQSYMPYEVQILNTSQNLGDNIEYKKIKAASNCLLQRETIQYFESLGIRNYDMDGLWFDEEIRKNPQLKGLNYFKLGFSGEVITRYFYKNLNSRTYKILSPLYKNGRKTFDYRRKMKIFNKEIFGVL